jgi:uncharacterized membrane protein
MFDVFNPIAFQIHGNGDGHGGLAGTVGDLLAFIETLLSMPAAEILAQLMPGIAAMGNVHPLFVHFPVAFLLVFFILDTLASLVKKEAWRTGAGWLLYLGTASVAVTVATGLYASATVPHGENVHEIMVHHEYLGLTVLSLAFVLSVWRWLGRRFLQGAVNVLYLSVAAVMIICITLGADLGGWMVYQYGINVGVATEPTHFDPDHSHAPEHSHDLDHSH